MWPLATTAVLIRNFIFKTFLLVDLSLTKVLKNRNVLVALHWLFTLLYFVKTGCCCNDVPFCFFVRVKKTTLFSICLSVCAVNDNTVL